MYQTVTKETQWVNTTAKYFEYYNLTYTKSMVNKSCLSRAEYQNQLIQA